MSTFINYLELAGAEVKTLDFKRWFGSGILHTKMWLIDRQHFYVGSANLDWRSLTQVTQTCHLVVMAILSHSTKFSISRVPVKDFELRSIYILGFTYLCFY